MEYKIVSFEAKTITEATQNVTDEVNYLMKYGWVPQGGVSVSISVVGYSSYYYVAQALVKQREELDPEEC